ncbi:bifunctional (p)ppGpp synthetase/guanosine-3',5'-bis(diphosphate) 3'-pyrophosphohydrolase [Candidatus Saccharibacteria bacterium HGW-Saccharibacteria-1]|nr:MAG: bifunctional (p)ppGpp synthetase/guanosine-3',5'-bis(diphosphate) 3'-pyrophosphohydrolase [Candidatus Saccharibacteria bacterium HGW-Saccharibacteria-1]
MINYTKKLDMAIRRAAWAHGKQKQYRNGTDIPYIIHPFGVMTIASNYTNDEDVLIACLMHDILEDVSIELYNESDMRLEFGDDITEIVKDVTKDSNLSDWHIQSKDYLNHLDNYACQKAVIVSAADKMHNLLSTLTDYEIVGDELWQRFTTKNVADQLWWYESILDVVSRRSEIADLNNDFAEKVAELNRLVSSC